MSASSSSSLRPAWHKGTSGGRGFQPPPTVSERGDKARSGSLGSQERSSSNKFAVLDDDEGPLPVLPGNGDKSNSTGNSRSEAFRSSFNRSSSTGTRPSGRSLADLAARVPEPAGPPVRRSSAFDPNRPGGSGRSRSVSEGSNGVDNFKPDPKVIRYTREKLLSIRPVPKDKEYPDTLKEHNGSPVLTDDPQDPVCWDTFDSEVIWESFREKRVAAGTGKGEAVAGGPRAADATAEPPRRRNAPSSGRWQRGIALPPPEEGGRRKNDNAENPEELWDDPGGVTGAASDFSAFGAMPMDAAEEFDFEKMAEATKRMDEELHGSSRHSENSDDQPHAVKAVDTSRPLASVGMTITSGSGDNVNVFEDFDDPSEPAKDEKTPAIRGATEDPSASSRLMKMIGVEPPKQEDSAAAANGPPSAGNPWGAGNPAEKTDPAVAGIDSIFGSIGGLSFNPWGGAPGGAAPAAPDGGSDLAGQLEALAAQQKVREQQIEMEKRAQQEAEMLRRRQHDEEAQRRVLAHRQAEEQARQQAAALQQQATQQSQVELVLMERICSILENSWGRSDLVSILTTLHSEDSRVIPLLSNVDALRALIARSPQRIALRRDPSFAGDMAVLLLTNTQYQQQQHAQARHQQEELRRRRLEEEARAQAQSRATVQINPDLPWFYSDPQNNIQGPFRGEEMRQWLEAGYFKGDLPISQQSSGPFHLLSALFPDLNLAFQAVPVNNVGGAERKALEEEKLRQEKTEAERRASEARKAAEREKAEAERKAAAENTAQGSNGGNESSTQLKMMLGLGASQGTSDPAELEAPARKKQPGEKKTSKANKKNQLKQAEEAPAPVPAKPAAAAWGGVASAKPKKSISEIQQEEARRTALESAQSGGGMPRQSSSGWANVAAGTQGWSSGVVKKVSPAAQTAGAPAVRMATSQTAGTSANGQPTVAGVNKAPAFSQSQRSSSTASASTPAEEFGATLSPALEKWCKEQMEKLTGSDDLTLIGFCMTLNDANEIRQYLQAYLGSGPKVSAFATEFIAKRGLGNKQEEWETPGSAKKGRKKKGGGR